MLIIASVVLVIASVVLVIASVVLLEVLPWVVGSESLELELLSVTPVASDLLDSLASALDSLVPELLDSLLPELDAPTPVVDSLMPVLDSVVSVPLGLDTLIPTLDAKYEEVLDSEEISEVSVTNKKNKLV